MSQVRSNSASSVRTQAKRATETPANQQNQNIAKAAAAAAATLTETMMIAAIASPPKTSSNDNPINNTVTHKKTSQEAGEIHTSPSDYQVFEKIFQEAREIYTSPPNDYQQFVKYLNEPMNPYTNIAIYAIGYAHAKMTGTTLPDENLQSFIVKFGMNIIDKTPHRMAVGFMRSAIQEEERTLSKYVVRRPPITHTTSTLPLTEENLRMTIGLKPLLAILDKSKKNDCGGDDRIIIIEWDKSVIKSADDPSPSLPKEDSSDSSIAITTTIQSRPLQTVNSNQQPAIGKSKTQVPTILFKDRAVSGTIAHEEILKEAKNVYQSTDDYEKFVISLDEPMPWYVSSALDAAGYAQAKMVAKRFSDDDLRKFITEFTTYILKYQTPCRVAFNFMRSSIEESERNNSY